MEQQNENTENTQDQLPVNDRKETSRVPKTVFQFKIVHLILLLTVSAILLAYSWPASPYDQDLAKQVQLVLRINNNGFGEGSKYIWTEADVIAVIKNKTSQPIPARIKIAFYSFGKGLPGGKSTVYLIPYNSSDPSLGWKLFEQRIDSELTAGYSHSEFEADKVP